MTTKDDFETVVPPSTDDINSDLQRVFELDRIIHEPARLVILAALSKVEEVDFKFLQMVTGLTKGNLSRQATNLEEAGYIEIRKYYRHKVPATGYRITDTGRRAFAQYWDQMAALQQRFQDEDSNHEHDEDSNHEKEE